MVVGKAPNGNNLVVGGGDGGYIPNAGPQASQGGVANDSLGAGAGGGQQVGYGNAGLKDTKGGSGIGEPLGS